MKITEDVRKFGAEQKISDEQAFQVGLEKKTTALAKADTNIYAEASDG